MSSDFYKGEKIVCVEDIGSQFLRKGELYTFDHDIEDNLIHIQEQSASYYPHESSYMKLRFISLDQHPMEEAIILMADELMLMDVNIHSPGKPYPLEIAEIVYLNFFFKVSAPMKNPDARFLLHRGSPAH